ncbi:MAG: methyltransferase [Pseudomonadota bacterium]
MSVQTRSDSYLDGRVVAIQPAAGYRAGTDAVMLAACVAAKPDESVLELGAGAGIASLCLSWRLPNVQLTLVERDRVYIDLARLNLGEAARVVEADILSLPTAITTKTFDHVMMNPPFYRHKDTDAHPLKSTAHFEETPLSEWIDAARRRLRPGGWLWAIHRAERLADFLTHMTGFGDISILPIAARQGRAAKRILIGARKASSGPSRLISPFVMHDGNFHKDDGDDYSANARAVLREGAPIHLLE